MGRISVVNLYASMRLNTRWSLACSVYKARAPCDTSMSDGSKILTDCVSVRAICGFILRQFHLYCTLRLKSLGSLGDFSWYPWKYIKSDWIGNTSINMDTVTLSQLEIKVCSLKLILILIFNNYKSALKHKCSFRKEKKKRKTGK